MGVTDPRDLNNPGAAGPGGPHDHGQVVVDATKAILMDSVEVSMLDETPFVALFLGGRINRTRDRANVMFIFDSDGVAAIISELLALYGRSTGVDPSDLLDRMLKLREDGNLT